MPLDLHALPKVRDSWTYLYVEHARIDQDGKAIAIHDAEGVTPVPCASLSLLLLGPGTSISHAAIRALADNGCLAGWAGEEGVRFYALGSGETRSARNLMHQARLWAHPTTRLAVVLRMYRLRFDDELPMDLSLRQLRGHEGARVRDAYARAAAATGVEWRGRNVNRASWSAQDPINRALSSANACLYGVCHAAIVAAGYNSGLGFIHTGKMLSFVYDIADLYKVDFTIPAAFDATAAGSDDLESRTRRACRDMFRSGRLLPRIIDDIQTLLAIPPAPGLEAFDDDAALPGGLWDPVEGVVKGGINWADAIESANAEMRRRAPVSSRLPAGSDRSVESPGPDDEMPPATLNLTAAPPAALLPTPPPDPAPTGIARTGIARTAEASDAGSAPDGPESGDNDLYEGGDA